MNHYVKDSYDVLWLANVKLCAKDSNDRLVAGKWEALYQRQRLTSYAMNGLKVMIKTCEMRKKKNVQVLSRVVFCLLVVEINTNEGSGLTVFWSVCSRIFTTF